MASENDTLLQSQALQTRKGAFINSDSKCQKIASPGYIMHLTSAPDITHEDLRIWKKLVNELLVACKTK